MIFGVFAILGFYLRDAHRETMPKLQVVVHDSDGLLVSGEVRISDLEKEQETW